MHLLVMCVFAAVVASVIAIVDPERLRAPDKVRYGIKVFAAFVGVAIVLGWLMRFVPF